MNTTAEKTKAKRIHITPPPGSLELARRLYPFAATDADALKMLLREVVRAKTLGGEK